MTPGRSQQLGDELAAAGAEVVDDHDLDAVGAQAVGERAADEAGSAGDAGASHRVYSVKPAATRVAVEHLHGLQRELIEVLAEQVELLEQVVGHGDDVAADLVGLHDVEDLARRGPDQLGARRRDHDVDGARHDRHRIDAGVGDPAGEHRDVGRRAVLDRLGDQLDLRGREQRRDVDLHAALGELAHERRHRLAARSSMTGILT